MKKVFFRTDFDYINSRLIGAGVFFRHSVIAHSLMFVLVVSCFILLGETNAFAFNSEKYKTVCGKVLKIFDSEFGALLSACAGVGAIVASASGGFRAAWALVVVAVGSFTLKEYQEIWFPSCL
ncbi:MAG TPA: hypothetical protein PKA63_06940 [Oligoflexia bacterium]|nr:hypothetical protein [Oligoflexia bacterium]HMP48386.1 hypothetical protein [Oligoflexia bacterium]